MSSEEVIARSLVHSHCPVHQLQRKAASIALNEFQADTVVPAVLTEDQYDRTAPKRSTDPVVAVPSRQE